MSELSAAAGVNYDGPFDTLFSCAPSPAAAYTAEMALTEAGCVRARHRAARRRCVPMPGVACGRGPHHGVPNG